jgi:uncharacterized membrane protein
MFGSKNGVRFLILGALFSAFWAIFKIFLLFGVEMKSGFSVEFLQAHSWDIFLILNSLSLSEILRRLAIHKLEARIAARAVLS